MSEYTIDFVVLGEWKLMSPSTDGSRIEDLGLVIPVSLNPDFLPVYMCRVVIYMCRVVCPNLTMLYMSLGSSKALCCGSQAGENFRF